jgi:hypothetical protein
MSTLIVVFIAAASLGSFEFAAIRWGARTDERLDWRRVTD